MLGESESYVLYGVKDTEGAPSAGGVLALAGVLLKRQLRLTVHDDDKNRRIS